MGRLGCSAGVAAARRDVVQGDGGAVPGNLDGVRVLALPHVDHDVQAGHAVPPHQPRRQQPYRQPCKGTGGLIRCAQCMKMFLLITVKTQELL